MAFRPNIDDALEIDGATYRVATHPAAPGMPYGQEGRQGIVFQLTSQDGTCRALKVFKPRFRIPGLVSLTDRLSSFAEIPGLQVCRRIVLSPRRHADLLREHPDLSYAVLMPWVIGPSWMDLILERRPITPAQSLILARSLADLLATLEERGLSHGDLSAPNVLLPGLAAASSGFPVALVDVEGMYGPGLERPEALPSGSAGYGHRAATQGLWGRDADRFAGAVLLAELLGWCDERVRVASGEESYFEPREVQQPGQRYDTLRVVLEQRWGGGVAHLLDQAWRSESLADCPTIGEWLVVIPQEVPVRGTSISRSMPLATDQPDNAVQTLLALADDLRRKGIHDGARETYQRALTLVPAGSGLDDEIRSMIAVLDPTKVPHSGDLEQSFRTASSNAEPWFNRLQIWQIIAGGVLIILLASTAILISARTGSFGEASSTVPTAAPSVSLSALPTWVPELVEVPTGPFLMGSTDQQIADAIGQGANSDWIVNEKPQDTLILPTYWIGKTEVTNAQFRLFAEGDGYTNRDYWDEASWQWREENKIFQPRCWGEPNFNRDTQPVVCITWYEALAYTRWLSTKTGMKFHLPSEAEWEKAARSTDGRFYPWGNTWEDSRANSKTSGIGITAPVGIYPSGVSPYGALDMAGNAWEWTRSIFAPYPYNPSDGREDTRDPAKKSFVIRGGAWIEDPFFLSSTCRIYLSPENNNQYIGFRVALNIIPTLSTQPIDAQATPTPLAGVSTVPVGPALATGTGTPLDLGSDGDLLAFNKIALYATAGTAYTVNFKNNSIAVQHNWVLVENNGVDTAVAAASAAMAKARNPAGAVPPGDTKGLLVAMPIVNAGDSGTVTFKAPAAGTYTFLCTFPGHYAAGMTGQMVVR